MSGRHLVRDLAACATTDQLPTRRAVLAWLITHATTPDRKETATLR